MKTKKLFSTIALLFFGVVGVFAQSVANAGIDRTLYLPYNTVTIPGDATNMDIVDGVQWELVSGTGTVTLGATTGSSLLLTNCTEGVYVFKYTVSYTTLIDPIVIGTTSDEMTLTVKNMEAMAPVSADPGRLVMKQFTAGTTLVTAEGNRLRGYWQGGYESVLNTEFNNPAFYKNLRNNGFNAIKVWWDKANANDKGIFPDVSDPVLVANSLSYMDSIVNLASRYGLHVMIQGGNIGYYQPGVYPFTSTKRVKIMEQWWSVLAARYKNRTHVAYEMQNEPFYTTYTEYPVVADSKKLLKIMRGQAPETQIMLFGYMISSAPMVSLVDDLATQMTDDGTPIDWTKTSVSFHGYGGGYSKDLAQIEALRAKYPAIMTEFWPEKGQGETYWPTTDRTDFYEMEGLEATELSWFSWCTHKTEGFDAFMPALIADLKTRGTMWSFTPIDFKEPVIDMVPDATIFSPANSIVLNATVTPEAGRTIVKYDWQLRKTTGSATLTPNGASLTLTNMVIGAYWLRLYAYDNLGYYACKDVRVVLTKKHPIPGKIEAEDFATMNNVETETCFDANGGLNVGWIYPDSYMDYVVNVAEAGMYHINLRVAADGLATAKSGMWKLLIDGVPATPLIQVMGTGGYQIFTTIYSNAVLPVGEHTLRFTDIVAGSNINWFNFTKTSATIVASPDQTFKLPITTANISVAATDPAGIKSYKWTIMQGAITAVIANSTTANATISNLTVGEYVFNVAITTNGDVQYNANVKVTVEPCLDVVTVSAGADVRITPPVSSIDLTGSANGDSGFSSYLWTQSSTNAVSPIATLIDADKLLLKVSGLLPNRVYYFTLKATSNGNCFETDEVKVTVNATPAGVESIDSNLSLNVYPNPAKSTVTIERTDWMDNNTTIQLIDLNGRVLLQTQCADSNMILNVDQIAKGMYFITVSSNNKVAHSKLLIE